MTRMGLQSSLGHPITSLATQSLPWLRSPFEGNCCQLYQWSFESDLSQQSIAGAGTTADGASLHDSVRLGQICRGLKDLPGTQGSAPDSRICPGLEVGVQGNVCNVTGVGYYSLVTVTWRNLHFIKDLVS